MFDLTKLTRQRLMGADRLIVPDNVWDEKIIKVSAADVDYLIKNRLFPFNKIVVEASNNGETYIEIVDSDRVAMLYDVGGGTYFTALIGINYIEINTDDSVYNDTAFALKQHIQIPHMAICARSEKDNRIIPQTIWKNEHREKIYEKVKFWFVAILTVFSYINSVCLAEPEIEEKEVKRPHRKSNKTRNNIKYISTRKYTLTGLEKRSRRNTPKIYTMEKWQVRGHWRTYRNGRRIWIKPYEVKRNKDKLQGKKIDERIYKVGV